MADEEVLVNKNNISIVRPNPNQWVLLRDLKIKSIEQDRLAFADPVPEIEKYKKRTEEDWRAIVAGKISGGRPGESIVLLAQDGQEYIGLVTAIIPRDSQTATVQHTFVDQFHRQKGIGKVLLTTLIEKLKQKPDLTGVELDVVTTQEAAIGLYKKLGFVIKGFTEQKATRDGKEYERYLMSLPLRS